MMKKLTIIFPVMFFLCSLTPLGLRAQENDKTIQNSRASFLSKKFNIGTSEAMSFVAFMDSTTQAMNKIFHDSTLSSEEKIKRLSNLEKMRKTKAKQVIQKKSDSGLSMSEKRRGDY